MFHRNVLLAGMEAVGLLTCFRTAEGWEAAVPAAAAALPGLSCWQATQTQPHRMHCTCQLHGAIAPVTPPNVLHWYLPLQVCKSGMTNARRIWLTRHGESLFNQKGLIGGDSSLSPNGAAYADVLPEVILSRLPKVRPACRKSTGWCSMDEQLFVRAGSSCARGRPQQQQCVLLRHCACSTTSSS
eukprot:GHRQ01027320.1.p1 GENE.GHRQ01027320.1~~GHRQ01027320.1.p1  ORF type:complete len:185 (+),score=35.38 GHRQ01027320.1:150-704(+)